MEKAKISNKVLRSLMNVDATQYSDPNRQPDNLTNLHNFKPSEIRSFLDKIYVYPEYSPTPVEHAQGVIPYLAPLHEEIGTRRIQTNKMVALAPEIEQSKILVSSSIMSPNDLQDGEYTFTLEGIGTFDNDPALAAKVTDVYSTYFNDELKLGIKSYDWIGETQYSSGAKALLILPLATQQAIVNRTDKDAANDISTLYKPFSTNQINKNKFQIDKSKVTAGMSSFENYLSKFNHNDDFLYSNKVVSWKDVLNNTDDIYKEVAPAMENFGAAYLNKNPSNSKSSKLRRNEFMQGVESMIVNLRTRLEEGDVIRVTENPEVLRFGVKKKAFTRKQNLDAVNRKYSQTLIEENMLILEANPEEYQHQGHPLLLELPTESVIPLIVPGAPTEHLGYFILIDSDGQPLTIDDNAVNSFTQPMDNMSNTDATYEAVFGAGDGNISRLFGNHYNQTQASSTIFQSLFERYLRTRLKGIFGHADLTISRFHAISTALFYRVLSRKKTTLVFAPPELLHYFAFAYDDNGIGLPKTANIQTLLSLRNTYVIATILAMANDAVEHKKITFSVDDKNANIEQTINMIQNIYSSKNRWNGSVDPAEITRDLISNSITIAPKNVPGLSEFEVDVDNSRSDATQPNNDLIEHLDNLIISQLDVPPAALNQLAEPEYAKSLVTYNLFFAKKVTRYQRIWCEHIRELIRDYVALDPVFQQDLLKVLQEHVKPQVGDHLPKSVQKLKDRNPNQRSTTYGSLLHAIIDNIDVKLPKPNIVVDDAQMEQIDKFSQNLDSLTDRLYDTELLLGDDDVGSKGLGIARALFKRQMMSYFIENVGNFNMIKLPDPTKVDDTNLIEFIQTMQNLGKRVQSQLDAMTTADDDDSWSSGSDDSGGSDADWDDGAGGDDDWSFKHKENESSHTNTNATGEAKKSYTRTIKLKPATKNSPELKINIKRKNRH